MHELFHRVQPDLRLLVNDGNNEHLETREGRYWTRLEWRALAATLRSSPSEQAGHLRDALSFRAKRRLLFPDGVAGEHASEINEGLPQYTGTVLAFPARSVAAGDIVDQLEAAERAPSFLRTFGYPMGSAYGFLLDSLAPEWRRHLVNTDDLGDLVGRAAGISPVADAEAAAAGYGGGELLAEEKTREANRLAEIAALRKVFVEGPVLILPNGRANAYRTAGATSIPGVGAVLPAFRTSGDWGSLEADRALVAADRSRIVVPAPAEVTAGSAKGPGWVLTIAKGWEVRPGDRAGDLVLQRDGTPRP